MPPLDFSEVLSFSSEDSNHCAANLIGLTKGKKWKINSSDVGKPSSVTLKLKKLSTISSIDIGNDGSAFVEVLVAREDEDFKPLLAASSFMSPVESRNESPVGRVRMFAKEKLSEETRDEKWLKIKVICAQPFNRTLQYGLSFLTLMSSDPHPTSSEVEVSAPLIAKEDSTNSQYKVGSLFQKRKLSSDVSPSDTSVEPKAKALAKDVTKVKESPVGKGSPKVKEGPSKVKIKGPPVTKDITKGDDASSHEVKGGATVKDNRRSIEMRAPRPKAVDSNRRYVPFSSLMAGVVYTLSGYQNPLRGMLRDKMNSMGAKYRPDWGRNCTHLICAFANTPKYNSVKGKGKIVKHNWIEDSYIFKKKMNWKRFSLEEETADSSDSETEELWAEELKPKTTLPLSKKDEQTTNADSVASCSKVVTDDHNEGYSSDSVSDDKDEVNTDDEIDAVMENKNKDTDVDAVMNNKNTDVYDAPTDEEDNNQMEVDLPPLLDCFDGKTFFVHGVGEGEKSVRRYIVAYGGTITDYMNDEVNYVITDKKWDKTFDEAKGDNDKVLFLKSQWIWNCSNEKKLFSSSDYLITSN